MGTFSDCWGKHASGLNDLDKQSILDRTETYKKEDGLSHGEAIKKSVQSHLDEAHAQLQSIYDQAGVKPTLVSQPTETPTASSIPKTAEVGAPKEEAPTTSEVSGVPKDRGISQAKTEAELGAGSVEPGIGAELGSGIEYGRDFINKGGDPRLPIRRATTTGLVGKNEVGIVHAELERLRGERSKAAQALEANPDDPELQKSFSEADNAQRAWRKELQPVLTKASDTLREAYAGSAPDADPGTYQGLADIFDEHFKGERQVTPEMRTEMAKAAKGVQRVRQSANDEMKNVEDTLVKQIKGGKVMSPIELDADLKSVLEGEFKNCVVGA